MSDEIEKVLDAWKVLAHELNKFPKNTEYMPFTIMWCDNTYVLSVDLSVFEVFDKVRLKGHL